MQRAAFAVLATMGFTVSALAQRETSIAFEGSVIESVRPEKTERPDVGGRDFNGGRNGASGRYDQHSNSYPALTEANNAYRRALLLWQNAYQQHQDALEQLAQFTEKYLDEEGNPRRGWEYSSVMAKLRSLDTNVDYTAYELTMAEKAKNSAHSRAVEEFHIASKQFAEAQRVRARETEAAERQSIRNDAHGNH